MKQKSRKRTCFVAILLCITTLLTTLPTVALPVFADGKQTAHDNPWDYTIFGNSINIPVNIMSGSNVNITGDIHANKSVNCLSNNINVDGTVEAVDKLSFGDINTDNHESQQVNIDKEVSGVESMELPNIYYTLVKQKTGETVSEVPDGKNANTAFTENIVSDDEILINNSDAVTDASCTQKSGAFSAKFLTEVYEHPETWKNVLPAFADSFKISEDSNGKKDILELVNNSRFSAVASEYPANNWGNLDKLPADAFMDNFNDNYVREAVNTAKAKIDSSKICTGNDVVTVNAAWDKNTVSPVAAVNAEKITVTGGNFTLDGDYGNLKELRLNNNGSAQLLGNYDKLEYIYTDNYINLNLAGNFPSLKCVYMPGGQLLLGTANKGFTSSSADIINENGSITVYTAKDVTLNDVNVLTVGRIAIRGRIAQEPANFNVDGTMFAATGIVIGDMIDNNEKKFSQIPVFFSQSGISVINCKFKLFQGSLLSRNGTMVFADSTIEVLHGFLFAQKGIDAQQFMAKEGVYIEGNGFNKHTGLSNELYKPSGTKLGTIEKLSSAVLPEKFAKISGTTEFKDQVTQTKIDGEYKSTSSIGVKENDGDIIFILAKNDININVDTFNTPLGKKMIIASEKGNVTISAKNDINFCGAVYAPEGTVTLDCKSADINGRIYGDVVDIKSYSLDMNCSYDEIGNYFAESSEKVEFKMPYFPYYEKKDLYVFDLDIAKNEYAVFTEKI